AFGSHGLPEPIRRILVPHDVPPYTVTIAPIADAQIEAALLRHVHTEQGNPHSRGLESATSISSRKLLGGHESGYAPADSTAARRRQTRSCWIGCPMVR